MKKTLDATVARALIERALESVGGKAMVKHARPVLAAAFEVARQSSRAAGKRSLSLSGISVNLGNQAVFQVVSSGPKKRTPIAYGGTGYTCYLIHPGPPPVYFCVYF